ncbi:hypothetical protein Bca4012_103818 [Brassica carinata]
MEESKSKALSVAVTLKGGTNYLLWSRLVKAAVGSKGLWSHISDGAPRPVAKEGEGGQELMVVDQEKWDQDDLKVLTVLHGSLEASILEAYSYCETPKDLWDTLQKVYGNISNLSRVFELKRSINTLVQEEVEFTKHLGKFRALWSELEMLRPNTTDQDVLMERREQDQVFGLLLTLNPVFNDLIKHILRSPKLPSLEDVCAQIQREEGSVGLFGGKGELTLANQADAVQANKAVYMTEEGKFGGKCDHCKKQGHKRSQCWILHPHLKPTKFMRDREARAHLSDGASEAGTSGAGQAMQEGVGKALTTQHTPGKSTDEREEVINETAIEPEVASEPLMETVPLRRSTRVRKDPSNWANTRVYYNAQAVAHPNQAVCSFAEFPNEHCAFMTSLDTSYIPRTYEEAMEDKEWRDSVADEADAMSKNGTWYESELPQGKKAVSCKWIFTIKYRPDGTVDRKKTRLVARGFTQTYGEDYIDTFAPAAKLHTIRIILSIATNLEWGLWQMDVKNAFLQGELEDEVYMQPPPGLESIVKPGNVLRLKKAIYGLKQSPRAWYHKLSTTLNGKGFRKSELDHTCEI